MRDRDLAGSGLILGLPLLRRVLSPYPDPDKAGERCSPSLPSKLCSSAAEFVGYWGLRAGMLV